MSTNIVRPRGGLVKPDFTKVKRKIAFEIAARLFLVKSAEEIAEAIKAIDPERKALQGEVIFPDEECQVILKAAEEGHFPLDLSKVLPPERVKVWERRLDQVVTVTSLPQHVADWKRVEEAERRYLEGLTVEDEALEALQEISKGVFYTLPEEEETSKERVDEVAVISRQGRQKAKQKNIELAKEALEALFTRDGKLTLRYWRGAFYEWTGTHYRELLRHDLRPRLSSFIARSGGDQDVNSQLLTNLTEVLEGLVHIPPYFEPPALIKQRDDNPGEIAVILRPGVIAFRNGVLDLEKWLETGEPELSPHTPELFTLVALPYDFDPNASCPRWLAFLQENLEGREERIKLLQEFAGYCLTYDTRFHKFLMLYGDAATGKSTFTSVLIAMLGPENVSHVPLEGFAERFGLARTVGRLANIVSEVGELDRIAEGHLKEFVAGDRMQIERKFQEAFEVKPTAKLIMATNNLPRFSDRSRGLWRRLIIIPFEHVIPEEKQDPYLADKIIESELPGVFLWAATGLARLRAQGQFSRCQEAEELAREYERMSNPARLFLEEHYEEAAGEEVICSEIYREYADWAQENGYQALNERNFGQEVRRVFPRVERQRRGTRANRHWVYVGIRPVSEIGEWEPKEWGWTR